MGFCHRIELDIYLLLFNLEIKSLFCYTIPNSSIFGISIHRVPTIQYPVVLKVGKIISTSFYSQNLRTNSKNGEIRALLPGYLMCQTKLYTIFAYTCIGQRNFETL